MMKVYRANVGGADDGALELLGIAPGLDGAAAIAARLGVSEEQVLFATLPDGTRRYLDLGEAGAIPPGYEGSLRWETPEEVADTEAKIVAYLRGVLRSGESPCPDYDLR